jgi:hypothetical protein
MIADAATAAAQCSGLKTIANLDFQSPISNPKSAIMVQDLLAEANQLVAIFVASARTAKQR